MKKEKLKDMRRIISDDEEGKAADSLKNESLRYLLKWAVSQVAGADRPFNVRGSNASTLGRRQTPTSTESAPAPSPWVNSRQVELEKAIRLTRES
jgi:hypothetical protein